MRLYPQGLCLPINDGKSSEHALVHRLQDAVTWCLAHHGAGKHDGDAAEMRMSSVYYTNSRTIRQKFSKC